MTIYKVCAKGGDPKLVDGIGFLYVVSGDIHEFFVHQELTERTGYALSHVRSGLRVCGGIPSMTVECGKEALQQVIDRVGEARVRSTMASAADI